MNYTMNDIKNIAKDIEIDLPKEVINIINFLASKVGAPSYKKTPNFNKKKAHYNNRGGNNDKITSDDWTAIRNFKKTIINKNTEGILLVIDEIRCLLNKITEKSYDEVKVLIFKKIEESKNNFGVDEFMSIGKLVFDIGSLNKYCSHLYAKIYKELIDMYPIFKNISDDNYVIYGKIFDEIRYVDSDEDYNLYCDINKENENRKSMSLFFANLMIHNVFSEDKIISIIKNLIENVDINVQIENKVEIIEEIVSNLVILISHTSSVFKSKSIWENIDSHIKKYTTAKKKDFKSLTTKIIFKYMDLIDNLED
jgi:hypothetical protein